MTNAGRPDKRTRRAELLQLGLGGVRVDAGIVVSSAMGLSALFGLEKDNADDV